MVQNFEVIFDIFNVDRIYTQVIKFLPKNQLLLLMFLLLLLMMMMTTTMTVTATAVCNIFIIAGNK